MNPFTKEELYALRRAMPLTSPGVQATTQRFLDTLDVLQAERDVLSCRNAASYCGKCEECIEHGRGST